MIRPITCVCFMLAAGAGFYLYQTKHRTLMVDRDIQSVLSETDKVRERTGMLHAEFQLLSDPARLSSLADHFLALKPVAPTQFVTLAEVDKRLPALRSYPAVSAPTFTPEPVVMPPVQAPLQAQPAQPQQSPPQAPQDIPIARAPSRPGSGQFATLGNAGSATASLGNVQPPAVPAQVAAAVAAPAPAAAAPAIAAAAPVVASARAPSRPAPERVAEKPATRTVAERRETVPAPERREVAAAAPAPRPVVVSQAMATTASRPYVPAAETMNRFARAQPAEPQSFGSMLGGSVLGTAHAAALPPPVPIAVSPTLPR